VRRWQAEDRLVTKRTPSGQRHVDEGDVRVALDIDLPEVRRRRIVSCQAGRTVGERNIRPSRTSQVRATNRK
jgi:hypothetical protein